MVDEKEKEKDEDEDLVENQRRCKRCRRIDEDNSFDPIFLLNQKTCLFLHVFLVFFFFSSLFFFLLFSVSSARKKKVDDATNVSSSTFSVILRIQEFVSFSPLSTVEEGKREKVREREEREQERMLEVKLG